MGLRLDLSSIEDYVANHLRLFIIAVAGLLVFVGIIAVSVFFIAVRGEEQTMVPNVVGKELTEALLELQVKELYPRINLRYSQTSLDKGLILEQDPRPGTIVKAGRRVRLVVSQGVIVNKVDNFIGRRIDDVRMDLQTVYTSAGGSPLLSIREPLMYEFSPENPGTILAQKPEPGTDISGPLTLEFVVSRGRENTTVAVPQLTGMNISETLELISSTGINFHFTARERIGNERGETVVSQSPPADTEASINTIVQLTVTNPERLERNEIFGIFRYSIPENPYPLEVRLEALLPSTERQRLFSVSYMGGEFTVPYRLPVGTVLILTMLNRELHRQTVGN
ncbi:MAG: PASTA domain-containing protein [Treponema sp.]|jgi:beta-lactam-binding protein with PASTA domain|nr:PASTA domain-containing protein [Treponema sp.]